MAKALRTSSENYEARFPKKVLCMPEICFFFIIIAFKMLKIELSFEHTRSRKRVTHFSQSMSVKVEEILRNLRLTY